MRNTYWFNLIVFIFALISFSCEEDINPTGALKNRYILTCILRGDTTLQTAFLSRSYLIDGAPGYYSSDPNLRAADIRIWHKDSVYLLKENPLGKSSSTNVVEYTHNNFIPRAGEAVEIIAELQNGKKLQAVATIPQPIKIDSVRSDTLAPMKGSSFVTIAWGPSQKNVYYAPRFVIIYQKKINGNLVCFRKYVPLRHEVKNGNEVEVYAAPSPLSSAVLEKSELDRAMSEISEGDINKEDYRIDEMMVEVMTLDANTGAYYSASIIQEDGFTVKIDQTDYTNVEGGLGLFGACVNKSFLLWMDSDYISSFRYIPLFK